MTSEPNREGTEGPFLLVGLGNYGREYRENRHNVGFMAIDRLAEKLGVSFSRMESKALLTRAEFAGQRVLLAKPQTYMNLSGQAVGALVRFYRIPLENLLVIYDDVDLPIGTLRIRPSGGAGGQKGMRSIIECLGTQDFPRLRIGIDRPAGRMDAAAYVLQDFSRDQAEILPGILDEAAQAALTFVEHGIETAMNQFNGLVE